MEETLVFWTSRPAPIAPCPRQVSGGTDKGTNELNSTISTTLWAPGGEGSRSLDPSASFPGGQGLQEEIKASFVVLSENHSWKLRSPSPQPAYHRASPLDDLENVAVAPWLPARGHDPVVLCALCGHHAQQFCLPPVAFTFISQNNSGKSCLHFTVEKLGLREVN